MALSTITAGYPVHAVVRYAAWENQHRARFITWRGACGETDTTTGRLGVANSARAAELCKACFPNGHHTVTPAAEQVVSRESV